MSLTFKRNLAILLVAIICFGWYVTAFGLGTSFEDAKKQLTYGLDINGGCYVVMEAQTDDMDLTETELKSLMDQTRAVINNRVNELGVAEASVTVEGTNRIRVEIPGLTDADDAIKAIGTTAQLTFITCDGEVRLSGEDVKDAQVATDGSYYKIVLEFSSNGATKFEEATKLAYNQELEVKMAGMEKNQIGIVLDGAIISHPNVKMVISGGSCEISGAYTKGEATNLAALIRGGALPVDLVEVQSSVQAATIGTNALDKSIVAGGIGLLLVFLIMILFFGLLGFLADIALALYVILFIWAMVGLNVVLTLPGIAALILSVGMAVDANVIIFDRIKEEIAAGKSIRVAVSAGFKGALVTVLDAQITTLIAAVVLYEIGTTQVKGFALTLMIGIILSIFTAVAVSQLFVSLLAQSKIFAKNIFFGMHKDGTPKKILKKKIPFIKNRKFFYGLSILVIIVGFVFMLVRGMNYGIDFTGGTTLQFEMHEQVEMSKIEKTLEEFDLDESIIYAGENNTQIQIKTIKSLETEEREKVVNKVLEEYKLTEDDILASELFGPSVGRELKANALKAIIIASIGMLIYILLRFKSWKYAVSAVIGVLHDALVVIAFYAIFGYTVNNPFIAAILTLVGYSINDTIVIFDRIRYNLKANNKEGFVENLDNSINQTLNRTILTSLTTIAVMVPLLLMVSDAIAEFIIPLMVGVIVGCYSSVCICTPLYYDFSKKEYSSKYLTQTAKTKKSKKNQ